VTLIAIHGHVPVVDPSAFVAPGAQLIGDVVVAAGASVWYNCVLRGDTNRITIGARSNVQDGSVIHCDGPRFDDPGMATTIGADCLIGHLAMLHGATVHDHGFVGIGSIVMDGCIIESDGMLGAGALLSPGKVVRTRELWLGRPARLVRMLSDAEVAMNRIGVAHYVENAKAHAAATGT